MLHLVLSQLILDKDVPKEYLQSQHFLSMLLTAMHYRVFSTLINSLIVSSKANSLWLLLWKCAVRFGVGLHKGYLGLQNIHTCTCTTPITITEWTSRNQVCNMFFYFLKMSKWKFTAMFYLIIRVSTVTQVEACSIVSLDHKRIISRVRRYKVSTGPRHIVIHVFTEVRLIRVWQNVVWGGIVKKQNIVQIGVWFGCGIPNLQCQTPVAYINKEKKY